MAEANSANSGRNRGLQNLRPFKPGQSGNPRGRPIRKPITDALVQVLKETLPEDKQRRTKLKLMAQAVVTAAIKGDIQAAKFVTAYIQGNAVQPLEVFNPEDEAFRHELVGDDRQANLQRLQELLQKAGVIPQGAITSSGGHQRTRSGARRKAKRGKDKGRSAVPGTDAPRTPSPGASGG